MLKAALLAIFMNLLSNRRRTIAEHEGQAAYNSGVYFGSKQVGAISKTWVANRDLKVRSEHRLLNGETVDIGSPFKVSGKEIRFPGDPLAPASLTINCRCRLKFSI